MKSEEEVSQLWRDPRNRTVFRCYKGGNINWIAIEPYYNSSNNFTGSSGWQVNLTRDLTDIYPTSEIRNIVQLSEEQLNYALHLIRMAKKGQLELTREGV